MGNSLSSVTTPLDEMLQNVAPTPQHEVFSPTTPPKSKQPPSPCTPENFDEAAANLKSKIDAPQKSKMCGICNTEKQKGHSEVCGNIQIQSHINFIRETVKRLFPRDHPSYSVLSECPQGTFPALEKEGCQGLICWLLHSIRTKVEGKNEDFFFHMFLRVFIVYERVVKAFEEGEAELKSQGSSRKEKCPFCLKEHGECNSTSIENSKELFEMLGGGLQVPGEPTIVPVLSHLSIAVMNVFTSITNECEETEDEIMVETVKLQVAYYYLLQHDTKRSISLRRLAQMLSPE